ncbi:hypothetical protein [Altererythrobacter sp. ZODW24]|uniref:hypothetical protein n=1 Tax=Altererythrobacter sp. ZODW24 TaxID=2185142 RepID=UPI0013B3FC76|nr:hypothetical protein [Altererythrobacter sp. ZODW24]
MTDQPDFDRFTMPADIPVRERSCRAATPAQGDRDVKSHSAGRGWIPASRDIGLPNDPVRRRARQDQEDFAAGLASASEANNHRAFTPARQVSFCDHLSTTGNVRTACARVGIAPQTAYRTRRREAGFAAAWEGALVLARDHAEAVLACRALEGVDEPVFYHGEEVARRRRYDPRLLLAHLARLDARVEDGAGQSGAEKAAERFDEVLAALGGHEPDEHLTGMVQHIGSEDDKAFARGAGGLGDALAVPRTAWVDFISEEVRSEALEAAQHPDAETYDELGRDPVKGAAEDARAEASAEWDAHFAAACAHVDAVCDAVPDESLTGVDEDLPDGCVTCVTLPACNHGSAAGKADQALMPGQCTEWHEKGCDYEAVSDGLDDGGSRSSGRSGDGSGSGSFGGNIGCGDRGAGRDRTG